MVPQVKEINRGSDSHYMSRDPFFFLMKPISSLGLDKRGATFNHILLKKNLR